MHEKGYEQISNFIYHTVECVQNRFLIKYLTAAMEWSKRVWQYYVTHEVTYFSRHNHISSGTCRRIIGVITLLSNLLHMKIKHHQCLFVVNTWKIKLVWDNICVTVCWRLCCSAGCCCCIVSTEWVTADVYWLSRKFTQYYPWCTSLPSQQNDTLCHIWPRTGKMYQDESM